MTFLGTVCLSYSYTLSLETGAEIRNRAVRKNVLFLYTHFPFIATKKTVFHFLYQTLSTSYVALNISL